MRTLLLDDKAEAAELCALYNLPLESQGGRSVAIVTKVWLLGPQGRLCAGSMGTTGSSLLHSLRFSQMHLNEFAGPVFNLLQARCRCLMS